MSSNILDIYLTASDLQDSPLLRDSWLHGQTISVDIRKGTPLLSSSSWQSHLDSDVKLGIGQRSAAGGSVELKSNGDVILQQGSTIDVSGGAVNYQSGYAPTSQLVYGGRSYDIASAAADKPYDRLVAARPGPRNFEYGYSQGYSAGSITVERAGGRSARDAQGYGRRRGPISAMSPAVPIPSAACW